ncbi:23S rRNA (guanosine(2251)-2'-O)-methyltransferase RlmB [Pleionea mediterranea]|jgi:23S rRNA (guanosine2251-2'-O)-methyltransferase|uniref:23S rRNA (guanosine-2'-O-)-methyltransferase RlmB n=1 Tax=Pleionea mediterranea TaxID=523701 RepID=A0A316FGM0_9GAMM|nr:23S rRNA (guanosine(2251)-2'-O)-methyltransferase RlmB [Pleionea mediterranea]PWK47265.1 23S rRNA Gm-2251 2'-O-methyltransferase [Pleionea mediterranea]
MSDKIVCGIHAVELLLKKSVDQVSKIYLQANRQDGKVQKLVALAAKHKIPVVRWDKSKLDAMTDDNHQGMIAELANTGALVQGENDLYQLVEDKQSNVLLLILDGVTDPHNLGACFRTADAAGVDAVIVPKDKSVGLNTTVRKVACGAAETVPFFAVTNLVRALKTLQDLGVWIIGTAGEAEQTLHQTTFKGSLALVMGAEDKGMRRLTRENCDELIKIPMQGAVSSLNVSVATGVCLFEMVRQREG